jgi:hypothetical protein
VTAVLLLLALVGAPSASAAESHAFSSSFGSGGSGAGQLALTAHSGVAVDSATHDVYVADTGNGRVSEFEADGTFLRSFGSFTTPGFIAVDNSGGTAEGDVYVADSATNTVFRFEADGTPDSLWGTLGQLDGSSSTGGVFGELDGIAVNAAGNLFVLSGEQRVATFGPEGGFLEEFNVQYPAAPLGLAVDDSAGASTGDIYTRYVAGPETLKFTASGEFLAEPDLGSGTGIAVDAGNGDLYVAHEHDIARYDPAAAPAETFGSAEPSGGELQAPAGVSVDSVDHSVFLVDAGAQRIDVFGALKFADVATAPASAVTTTSATLNGEVNPAGLEVTACVFEYGETTAYGQSAACETEDGEPVGSGTSAVPVHANLTGLHAGRAYHFRLAATNVNGTNRQSADQSFNTGISIDATSVSEVDDESARLEAELNPHGVASEYRFEYDTTPYAQGEAAHGTKVPIPDASIGSGTSDTAVSNLIQGLTPSTTYHYRVIAHNELGEVQGSDHSFTTQGPSSTLPDGRTWEMVSPPNKHGEPLEPITEEGGLIQTAPGGGAFAYVAGGPIGEEPKGVRSPHDSQLLSTRDPVKGWSTQDISTPHEELAPYHGGFPSEYQLFAEDLSASVVEPEGATPLSSQTTERTPYRREANGEFVPLVTAANVPSGTKFGGEEIEAGDGAWTNGVKFETATPDLGHIVLSSRHVLAPGFKEGFEPREASLYELSGGALRLVSVLRDKRPAAEEDRAAAVGNGENMRGAISSDGGRVFFQSTGELLMRDVGLSKTLQLDHAQPGASGTSGGGGFQAASGDGSRVFFTDTSRLTTDATATETQPDLYMCEISVSAGEPSCALSDLTVDHNAGEAANVQGTVTAIDQSGGHVYFVARGVLTDTPNAQGEHAMVGGPNLYEYDTGARQVHLVAVLSSEDRAIVEASSELSTLTARSSPDGRYFAFMSQRSLTGYDNRDAHSGQPDAEVYLFDASGDSLRCVSCDPSGARPEGVFDTSVFPFLLVDKRHSWSQRWLAGSVPGWTAQSIFRAPYQSRYLSNSGRMFFNAADALVPQDTNKLEDVYQYEPPGVGDCTSASATFSPTSGGCVGLISSGASKEESAFLDASENGDEVFFLTVSQLSSSDVDGAFDVYDAHVCSASSPCPSPPPTIPGCEGDACQSLSSPPGEITPGSLTYKGPGNAPPPARKAKAKPTRAQLLARALKACKKKKTKSKRLACKKHARKRYGAKKASVRRARKATPSHAPSMAPNPSPALSPTLPGTAPNQEAQLASPSNGFLAAPATAGSAQASPAPWWHLTSRQVPAHIAPGGEGKIIVQAINLGNAPTSGKYEFSDLLPPGMTLQGVEYYAPFPPGNPTRSTDFAPFGYCKTTPSSASCSTTGSFGELKAATPYEFLEMRLKVKDEGVEPGASNELSASGGGAATATAKRPAAISSEPAGFGVGEFTLTPEEEGGAPDTRAGSHPYQLTNSLSFNRDKLQPFSVPALPRNLHFKLPPGLIGSATALAQCSDQDFAHILPGSLAGSANLCPSDTAIGVVVVVVSLSSNLEETVVAPVFNLTPAQGEPARFGFDVLGKPVILDTAVRSGPGEDYGVTVNVSNITEVAAFISATTTFWGVPGDPSHDSARSWGCLLSGEVGKQSGIECEPSNQAQPQAFLTLPTNCEQPFVPTLDGVSWPKIATAGAAAESLSFGPIKDPLQDSSGTLLSLTGCNQLAFAPSFEARPSSQSASSPSGLDVNLNFHDEGLTSANGVAQSQLKDTTVALPEGLTINPSSGVGLGGCTSADYEAETLESPPGAGCPNNSKLGTVEITTPLLTQTIHGSLFIAQPHENPFDSLIALYIVAKNPETGILIKLAGKVTPDPVTGRLTTTFENNPQLPFDHFNFHFREGQQAPLITPPACGTYQTQALLTPWSEPLQSLTDSSPFSITSGVGGGLCPSGGLPPFSPQITSGTINNPAGAPSPFYLRLSRGDGDAEITSFSNNLPPGLTGILTGIPFCPEANIALARAKTGQQEKAAPSCPQASELGHSEVGTGVGAVLAYTPGKIYLAGPYHGDPFSLVSVTSAVVGPFDLGTVVIRFGLRLDPHTVQVSVDPTASEPIPRIIDGIVTHVRDIRVLIDRPGFTINPTSCSPMSISSTLGSVFGQSATVSSPFQAASCQSLKFAPKFSVFTAGKTSKASGASLHVKLAYPPGPLGTYANLAKAKVSLPKQLPSRLSTLQKACTAQVFNANPANCPAASIVGHAKVITPAIPEPLEGPAYFVSHGGEAFPDLTIVLKGYGVTVELVGSTQIKNGVTTSTFKSTPDVPFNTFELSLPQGPNSALAANANLCTSNLAMPTEFTAQNGAVLTQSTPIKVTGCKTIHRTSKQRLAKALKQCRKKASKAKRASCERQARRRFAVKGRAKAGSS